MCEIKKKKVMQAIHRNLGSITTTPNGYCYVTGVAIEMEEVAIFVYLRYFITSRLDNLLN